MRKYIPYGFDFKFQYKTYKNVGKTHWIDYKAKKNFLYKILRIVRNIINKNENKYKNFDTFSQWEHYIHEEFKTKKFDNKKDCIRYLERSKRNTEIFCDMIGAVVTPIYVVMITIGATLTMNTNIVNIDTNEPNMIKESLVYGYICMSIVLFFVLIFLMLQFFRHRRKIYFFKDLIIVLKKEHANH